MELTNFDPNGVGVDTGNYFGLSFSTEESKLIIISAPWDVTVSYGAGTAFAPDNIIGASTQLDLFDKSALNEWQQGIATADVDYNLQELSDRLRADAERVISHLEEGGSVDDESIQRRLNKINEGCRAMNENIYSQAREWLDKGKIVALVGGDHSTPYGLIRALGESFPQFGILHIDAHCDLRIAYEGFEFSHASIMHNVLRDVEQVERLVEVGVRDFCDMEYERAQSDPKIVMFDDKTLSEEEFKGVRWAEQCQRIISHLPQEVYISFDIDGLSPDNCPHTGTPVPGGLSFNQACYLIEQIVESKRRIIGFDVVEVASREGERIDEIVGARVLYKLALQSIKSNKQ